MYICKNIKTKHMGTKRIVVELDAEIVKAFKMYCYMQSKTIKQVVSDMVDAELLKADNETAQA